MTKEEILKQSIKIKTATITDINKLMKSYKYIYIGDSITYVSCRR